MKKLILCILTLFLTFNCCFADELRLDREAKYQKQVMQVGFRILNANQIDKRMIFYYSNDKTPNAALIHASKCVAIYKGILPFIDSEDELAAVISHEIAHGLDAHAGFWRRCGLIFKPNKYERKADKIGIDLMVNAGYNPVAMIVFMNKLSAEPSLIDDWGLRDHPAGSERLAYMYEYIYAKYPAYLADNEYKNNLYYQNFLLTSKKDRALIRAKYEEKYNVPVSDKTKKK